MLQKKKIKLVSNKDNGTSEPSRRIEKRKNLIQKNVALRVKNDSAIKKIVWPEPICKKCGKPITDVFLALSDKNTGEPVHFDCVLSLLKNSENLAENEEILYIGNGNFAVVFFENPKVRKRFQIKRIIEWEERNVLRVWKNEIAMLGSSI